MDTPTKPPLHTGRRLVVILFIAAIFTVFVHLATRDDLLLTPEPPQDPAPSLDQLTEAIELAETYLHGLYKPLGKISAVQSEHYGLPVRAFFPGTNTWALLGEDSTSSIIPSNSTESSEAYTITLRSGSLVVGVHVAWQAPNGDYSILVEPQIVSEPTELWIGTAKLGVVSPAKEYTVLALSSRDYSILASLRYTVRHATQQALMFWQMRGDRAKAERLTHFLTLNRYIPGLDMRTILFNRSVGLPDDLPFNPAVYKDCEYLPKVEPLAYPYKSKACKVLNTYFSIAQRDPFMQATYALHVLQKHKSPQHAYVGEELIQGNSPQETAEHLRKQWHRTKVGIPACTPVECQEVASGIRTFVYGTLEAELGYRYGDATAKHYADAAALNTLLAQVRDGKVRTVKSELYRPVFTGAVIAYWDARRRFAPPDPSILAEAVGAVVDSANMPLEYAGVMPSNSETTFDAWAFLMRYRCLRYSVECYSPQ